MTEYVFHLFVKSNSCNSSAISGLQHNVAAHTFQPRSGKILVKFGLMHVTK